MSEMNHEEMEEIKRYFGVVAEGLDRKIQQIAEGVTNLGETFDRDMTALRGENEAGHREILAAVKFSYAELDRRMTTVEREIVSFKTRLENLESRR